MKVNFCDLLHHMICNECLYQPSVEAEINVWINKHSEFMYRYGADRQNTILSLVYAILQLDMEHKMILLATHNHHMLMAISEVHGDYINMPYTI